MRDYVITTDSSSDLPEEYYKEHGVGCTYLSYSMDGKNYTHENFLPVQEFYDAMRKGSLPTTAQVNPDDVRQLIEPYLKEGKDVLHIAFSSGLSGTCGSVAIAARELMEEDPECRITVIDSLAASLGQGLLVHKALEQQKKGLSYEELVQWLEEHRLNVCHNFTVDDLFHLYRGGRVSKAAAVVGTMINLKPLLHVDNEGKLIPVGKVRGRKKSLTALVDAMEQQIGSWRDKNDVVFISHGDCIEDAEFVKKLVEQRFGIQNFIINPVGPTIGAHSGPGTLALFYMGDVR